jgi:hypothetical protein
VTIGRAMYSLETPCFHFSVLSQKTGISEDFNKYMKLASREPNDFSPSSCFMEPENAKIFQVLKSRNDFIMQNYYVKRWKHLFTALIIITREKLKVIYNFLSTNHTI